MDYAPLLSRIYKSALIVYFVYDKFRDDQRATQFTYHELSEHLGLAPATIVKANTILKDIGLIEEIEETSSGKKYRVLPIKKLSEELRSEILTKYNVEPYEPKKSPLRKKYLEEHIPSDFQQLLNKKVLKAAYKELGSSFTSAKKLCQYFKIDTHTFKLLHERDGEFSFKNRLKNLMKEIEAEAQVAADRKAIKRAEQYGSDERELTKYLYDTLAAVGARPIDKNWFLKNCNIAHSLFVKGVTLDECKAMIKWGFEDKWWKDKIIDLSSLNTMYPRFKLQVVKLPIASNATDRTTQIPTTIKQQIAQVTTHIQVDTYEDAYLLKSSVLSGEANKDIAKIVDILESNGILPKGQSNLIFG